MVYSAAHVIVREEVAGIEGEQTFVHFLLKPGVVVNVVCHQLLHNLIRRLARFGSDLVQPASRLGSKEICIV